MKTKRTRTIATEEPEAKAKAKRIKTATTTTTATEEPTEKNKDKTFKTDKTEEEVLKRTNSLTETINKCLQCLLEYQEKEKEWKQYAYRLQEEYRDIRKEKDVTPDGNTVVNCTFQSRVDNNHVPYEIEHPIDVFNRLKEKLEKAKEAYKKSTKDGVTDEKLFRELLQN
jgi:hypothetical protein